MAKLNVNGRVLEVDADPDTPLLWAIREQIGLTGTKYGCGVAQCGACTVHLDGKAARSCVTDVGVAALAEITTIEGLSKDGSHPCQQAWVDGGVPQCGFCQPGQIMAAAALLKNRPKLDDKGKPMPRLTDQEIDDAMRGNICRCGTYPRIREAIKIAEEKLS